MKKILLALLTAILLLTFSGCGKEQPDTQAGSSVPTESAPSEDSAAELHLVGDTITTKNNYKLVLKDGYFTDRISEKEDDTFFLPTSDASAPAAPAGKAYFTYNISLQYLSEDSFDLKLMQQADPNTPHCLAFASAFTYPFDPMKPTDLTTYSDVKVAGRKYSASKENSKSSIPWQVLSFQEAEIKPASENSVLHIDGSKDEIHEFRIVVEIPEELFASYKDYNGCALTCIDAEPLRFDCWKMEAYEEKQ